MDDCRIVKAVASRLVAVHWRAPAAPALPNQQRRHPLRQERAVRRQRGERQTVLMCHGATQPLHHAADGEHPPGLPRGRAHGEVGLRVLHKAPLGRISLRVRHRHQIRGEAAEQLAL